MNQGLNYSIKELDFESYGYLKTWESDDTWIFKKKEKSGRPLTIIYNKKEQSMRLRYPRELGLYSVILGKIKVSNRDDLDFIFDRIGHDTL